LFCLLKQIINRLSADADNRNTDYRPIIGAPLVNMCVNRRTNGW